MKRLRLPKTRPKKRRCSGKGPRWERSVAKQLSLWLSGGTNDSLLWRSAGSGARATMAKRKEVYEVHGGDLSATHPDAFKFTKVFYIECKSYKDFVMDQLLGDKKGTFLPMWLKCRKEATEANKLPMLIGKQNNREPLVFVSGDGVSAFGSDFFRWSDETNSWGSMCKCYCPQYDMWIYTLKDVLSHVKPELITAPRKRLNDSINSRPPFN